MDEDIKRVEDDIQHIEEAICSRSFAMEVLRELKANCKKLWIALFVLIAMLVSTNMAWLLVFQSYDYSSTTTYEAAGVYALIDSEGNIISQDISPETWEKYTEWWRVYGESKNNQDQNKD